MKYKAVIFDLGGTLIKETPNSEKKTLIRNIAASLSVPAAEFEILWNTGFNKQLQGGLFNSCGEYIAHICKQMGAVTREGQIEASSELFNSMIKRIISSPRENVISLLENLKSKKLKIALISNCAPEVGVAWGSSPLAKLFDTTIFSYAEGLLKPSLDIYKLCVKRLALEAQECIYVADGKYQELTASSSIGMFTIQLRSPGETDNDPERQKWNGDKINALTELLTFVGN